MNGEAFPIVLLPGPLPPLPVLVSIPHFGTATVPDVLDDDYREPRFRDFPFGYTDPFAPQIYAPLHACGATVVATPVSRLFVDVNRARDDYRVRDGAVRSRRGVVRTHVRGEQPLFRRSLSLQAAEQRLAAFYDPYHAMLAERLEGLRRRFGRAMLVDGHTADATRMSGHEVVIGTARGRACCMPLARGVGAIVRRHGFACSFDVPGYSGGHIVRRYGAPAGPVQAVQIEFNATRIVGCTRREHAEAGRSGALPRHDAARLARCIVCMRDVVRWLGGRQMPADG